MNCFRCGVQIAEEQSGICDACLSCINKRLFKVNEELNKKELEETENEKIQNKKEF